MTRTRSTPELVAANRMKVIRCVRLGREYACGDIARLSRLPETVANKTAADLRDMGLLEAGSVAGYLVYRLKRKEAAE